MPITDADLETVGLSADPRFIALIERSRAFYKPGTGIPLEEIRRKHEAPQGHAQAPRTEHTPLSLTSCSAQASIAP